MKQGIKKSDNYFERRRFARKVQNYRYNFIDYLYYQGDRYKKRWPTSCCGWSMISWYWIGMVFAPTLILFFPEIINIGNALTDVLIGYFSPSIVLILVILLFLLALELPPALWCIFRYKEDRVAAIKHHYRQSIWKNSISIWLILFAPVLVIIAAALYVATHGYG